MSDSATNRQNKLKEIQASIFANYEKRTPTSASLFKRACNSLAGGTTGNLRYFQPYPIYEKGGKSSRVYDVDDNEYIDCFLCNGPLLLGHKHPAVIASIEKYKNIGPLVVNPEIIIDAAELVQETVPCAERIRFLNSGTEAVIMAVRYARAYSGKSKVIKFYGHYHGQHDQFLTGLGTSNDPFGAGVPVATTSNTLLSPYGDIEELLQIINTNDDVAAIILDPAMHAGGLWGSTSDYLQTVRELTSKNNIVLIFDEVITGFRLSLGGGQSHFGVTPDLTTLGKALGAGEKLAAVAGKEEIMRVVDPHALADTPRVFQSGTGNDGTAAIAAGIGAINTYKALDAEGAYQHLHEIGKQLAGGIHAAFASRGIPCHVNQLGPMLQMFLSDEDASFERYASLDLEVLSLFFLALINEGVILTLPTSNHIYLSFYHSVEDINIVIAKVNVVLDKYDFKSIT
ncbi:MAG: aminotransferase class III-fold pyridoxal phosphate-dependent enzyme [Gammaproteobacteria bacterium]|nr:aminotransferase class III-fold pyridoxal phosphate-dependent enzyme [Gammaproteobacteria bacterium]